MSRTLLLPLLLIAVSASADDVYLKGAGKVSGRIVSQTETSIQVDVGAGTITVPMSRVDRIESGRTALDEYAERAARIGPERRRRVGASSATGRLRADSTRRLARPMSARSESIRRTRPRTGRSGECSRTASG